MARRYGNQKPRIDQFNDGDIWLADKTLTLLDEYGIKLLPWQKKIVYRWLAVIWDEDEQKWRWANPKAGLLVPRQNGKTEIIIARIIGGMIFMNEALIYTAHSDKTVEAVRRHRKRSAPRCVVSRVDSVETDPLPVLDPPSRHTPRPVALWSTC